MLGCVGTTGRETKDGYGSRKGLDGYPTEEGVGSGKGEGCDKDGTS
jgi:hypothetical protein